MQKVAFNFTVLTAILLMTSCGGASGSRTEGTDEASIDLEFAESQNLSGDVSQGQFIFGLSKASQRISGCNPGAGCDALFEGVTDDGTKQIESNGRVCTDCHRPNANLQLGTLLPLGNKISNEDPLLKFIDADSQFNPDATFNLKEHGLILIRPLRFAGLKEDDPFRKFIGWRKIPSNFNTVFGHGFVSDLREKDLGTTDTAASMSHTQLEDIPFRKVIGERRLADLRAFQSTLLTDPRLEGLLHPGDDSYKPSFKDLTADPFLTVPVSTAQEERGKELFNRWCFTCHNVPQIFNNRSNADTNNSAIKGQGYDIGVSQRNKLNLDFRFFNFNTGQKEQITLPLQRQDGKTVQVIIQDDIGLAAITKRYEDLHVFKVPSLRNLSAMGTYMHDGSLKSIEEVVKYFNSDHFRASSGGKQFPVFLTQEEELDLITFLRKL